MFEDNFDQFKDGCTKEVLASSPKVLG
jgi:hypothetical protein